MTAVLLGLVTLACGDAAGPDARGPTFTRAQVDGVEWTASSTYATRDATPSNPLLLLSATRSQNTDYGSTIDEFISLALVVPLHPGTFDIAATTPALAAYTSAERYGATPFRTWTYLSRDDLPGRLIVSAVDTAEGVVAGSFSFSAARTDSASRVIVAGTFRMSYASVEP